MLTLIKSIHVLNRRIEQANTVAQRVQYDQISSKKNRQQSIRFQSICTAIALGLGGLSRVEIAQAKPLDNNTATIAQAKKPAPAKPAKVTKPAATTPVVQSAPVAPATPAAPVAPVAPVAPPAPPAPSPTNTKLINELNLPKTGNDVRITGNQSITLQQAIDIAYRNNRQIQAARLTVDRSQTGVGLAQSGQSIQARLRSTLQTQGGPLIIGTQEFNSTSDTNINGILDISYPILDAGRNQGNIRAAEEQVKFDKLDLLRIEQAIRGQVITAYYDLQEADSSIIINQAAVTDAARSLSDAQLQEKAGVGTKFDILRAQVQLATANQNLTSAQGQQQTARKKIAQLLVVDQSTEFKAADPVRELGNWGYSLEDSVVLAYKNRPEAKQQISLRTISTQQQIVASAANSAQVDLFADYSLSKSLTSNVSASDNYSAGARFTWSFGDGGAASANANREKVNQEIYENQFTTARNQIRFEVEQAYYSLGTNKKNIATSTQALQQAEESLKLARLRFQAGVGTQTDVIQAQTALATARGNRITAVLNYNRALSNLRTATILAE
jgi:outer membrane protein TolC